MAGERHSARTEGLVVEEIGDELLIYDLDTDEAHSLDPAAAAIWRACDGTTTVAGIAARLNLDDAAVQATVKHLAELNLLTGETPAVTVTHSRRAVLRRGLVAGTAGVAVVTGIRSIVAPTAQAQASGCQATLGQAAPCSASCECTQGCCCTGGLAGNGAYCGDLNFCIGALAGHCI